MLDVLAAIAPIFLLIALGALLKAKAGFGEDFWRHAERLTFNWLFPALLFVKIAEADVQWGSALPISSAIVIGILLTAAVAIPLKPLLGLSPEKFVAVYQGGFRPNAYVGIAITLGILGDAATGAMAVSLLTIGVTINIMGVVGHLYWIPNPHGRSGISGIALDTIKNPLILGCVLGGIFNAVGWGLPPIIGPTLDLMSRAALPMGLMAVGAGLSLSAAARAGAPVALSSMIKLILHPALTFGLCIAFGLEGVALLVPVVFTALPTSSTAYVVSRQMGSDPGLMAAIITASHLGAIVTLPVLLAYLGHGL